ncbi:hypothetical protein [Bradyrhizobium sp.]|jgi:hypothetical protein|nr:hypothetical protein [Bradyrhizobium sp.]
MKEMIDWAEMLMLSCRPNEAGDANDRHPVISRGSGFDGSSLPK